MRPTTNILVVEDNPGDQGLILEAFKKHNERVQIHLAPDGLAALDFLCRRGNHANAVVPSLVLLDLNLPKRTGLDVLKEMKQNPNLKRIPVVIFTTSCTDTDIKECYEWHANAFITKPSDLDVFFSVIKTIQDFWIGIAQQPSSVA